MTLRVSFLSALLLVFAMAIAAHWSTLDLGPVGQDTVILVASSQVHSVADLRSLVTSELRREIRPSTAFYRPLVNLSFAADEWVADSSWRQLHRSSVVWHAVASVGLLLMMLRLGVPLAWAAAGALVFALHPLAVEVVPAPARRGESMAVALLALSCATWPASGSRWRSALALALAAVAPLAKESAFIVPLLWAALPEPGRRRRLALGAAAMIPALVLRSAVLASGGGYAGWSFTARGLVDTSLDLFDVHRLSGGWGVRALVLALIALAASDLRRHRVWRGWVLGGVWMAASLAMLSLAHGIAAWYAYVPLAGAVVFASGVLRESLGGDARWLRGIALGMGTLLLGVSLAGSPLWTGYPEWRWIGVESARTLAASDEIDLQGRNEIAVAALPREAVALPRRRFAVRSATGVVDDTLRAWWRWRRGIDVQVRSVVDLALHAARTGPTRVDVAEDWRVVSPASSTLLLPGWPADRGLRIDDEQRSARWERGGRKVWLWTGVRWRPVGP